MENKMLYIRNHVPQAACYEMLAEEAIEVAHAALKIARILRGENPTPVELKKAKQKLYEEMIDLQVATDAADDPWGFVPIDYSKKVDRWYDRLVKKENEDE